MRPLRPVHRNALRSAFGLSDGPRPELFFVVTPDSGELAELAGMVDKGRLRAVVSQTFPLSDGRRAFASAGHVRPPGKTVLIVR